MKEIKSLQGHRWFIWAIVSIVVILGGLTTYIMYVTQIDSLEIVFQSPIKIIKSQRKVTVAQAEKLISDFQKDAKSQSSEKLKQEILTNVKKLMNKYEVVMGYKMSSYIWEYQKRNPNDSEINMAVGSMFNKYGPCWGIPDGQCKE
ncbi:MAG: hypothetical protein WC794_06090 [Candidatus Doudnabacteria bacterium]|jgi:hypothetical protein